jgi:hypothetical protein
MSEVRLDLARPQHGWMTMTLRVGAAIWEGDASYVVDSLFDLVSAALELSEGRPARPVLVHEEPGTSRIELVATGDDVRISITNHADLAPARDGVQGSQALAATVRRVDLLRAITDAIRRLESELDRPAIAQGWGHPFPADEVEQLLGSL